MSTNQIATRTRRFTVQANLPSPHPFSLARAIGLGGLRLAIPHPDDPSREIIFPLEAATIVLYPPEEFAQQPDDVAPPGACATSQ
jgi:hypothetical protein